MFLSYSINSRTYRVLNLRTKTIMGSINVVVDDFNDFTSVSSEDESVTDVVTQDIQENTAEHSVAITFATKAVTHIFDLTIIDPPTIIEKNHHTKNIIGDLTEGIKTRDKPKKNYQDMIRYVCYTSSIEPKNINKVLQNEYWVKAMQEELEQFMRNDVWRLISRPKDTNVIGTKWIFKNKSDASSNITRNKARLVAQGYTQIEGIDFNEIFAPIARTESIRLFLAIACLLGFKWFQMEVKSAFLNEILNEEVYVEQPKGFEDSHNSDHVYILKKTLYGLKQVPWAWYERLTKILINNGYKRGGVDKTLFIKRFKSEIIIAHIYVDDIVFGSTSQSKLNDSVIK